MNVNYYVNERFSSYFDIVHTNCVYSIENFNFYGKNLIRGTFMDRKILHYLLDILHNKFNSWKSLKSKRSPRECYDRTIFKCLIFIVTEKEEARHIGRCSLKPLGKHHQDLKAIAKCLLDFFI